MPRQTRIGFKYEISGPRSVDLDPADFDDARSLEDLRLLVMGAMENRVTWSIIPDSDDLAALWERVQSEQA